MGRYPNSNDELYNQMCDIVLNTAIVCHALCAKALRPYNFESCLGQIRDRMIKLENAVKLMQKQWKEERNV